MQERRYAGKEGCRKGGVQCRKGGVQEGKGAVQERRVAVRERRGAVRERRVKERMDTGNRLKYVAKTTRGDFCLYNFKETDTGIFLFDIAVSFRLLNLHIKLAFA